jgi:hypothetical protein
MQDEPIVEPIVESTPLESVVKTEVIVEDGVEKVEATLSDGSVEKINL